MSDKVIFYHNPMSRGRIAHWMLEEVGAPYETKILSFEKREHKAPEFLAVNPMGKIPAIVHRGTVVTESAAICAYLADAFPKAQLAPAPSDPARGTYYRWLFFGAGCIEPALVDKMFTRAPVERPGVLGYGNYEDTLERAREGNHAWAVHSRRAFQRRGRVRGLANRLRNADEEPRAAAGIRGVLRALLGAAGAQAHLGLALRSLLGILLPARRASPPRSRYNGGRRGDPRTLLKNRIGGNHANDLDQERSSFIRTRGRRDTSGCTAAAGATAAAGTHELFRH